MGVETGLQVAGGWEGDDYEGARQTGTGGCGGPSDRWRSECRSAGTRIGGEHGEGKEGWRGKRNEAKGLFTAISLEGRFPSQPATPSPPA